MYFEFVERMCHFSLLHFRRSLEYLEESLRMRQDLYVSGEHADVCISLNNVGVSWYYAGELAKAAEYLEQSLAMRRRLYTRSSLVVAEAEKSLATVYMEMAEWTKAVEHFEASLRIRQSLRHSNKLDQDEDVAVTKELYRDVATCYIALENYSRAAEYIPKPPGEEPRQQRERLTKDVRVARDDAYETEEREVHVNYAMVPDEAEPAAN
jgi:tetratricopeptide (TPR) repeat protein